ncbi:hypothetical protein CFT61_11825 [Segatella copri]|uniref:Uncharacterized protein n=1 Tax=Segatella copri TaxID=165179 RepID=A0AA91TIJ0_9BACT|nr:hypothetical protein CFT61_11825 [Segatella copri]
MYNLLYLKTAAKILLSDVNTKELNKKTSLRKHFPSGKKRKTALRCSEPLHYKVGGPIKGLARLCGMGPPECSSLQEWLKEIDFHL